MKKILGTSPLTTIAGLLLAGLQAAQTALTTGFTHWYDVAIPVSIAILGRLSADAAPTNRLKK